MTNNRYLDQNTKIFSNKLWNYQIVLKTRLKWALNQDNILIFVF